MSKQSCPFLYFLNFLCVSLCQHFSKYQLLFIITLTMEFQYRKKRVLLDFIRPDKGKWCFIPLKIKKKMIYLKRLFFFSFASQGQIQICLIDVSYSILYRKKNLINVSYFILHRIKKWPIIANIFREMKLLLSYWSDFFTLKFKFLWHQKCTRFSS